MRNTLVTPTQACGPYDACHYFFTLHLTTIRYFEVKNQLFPDVAISLLLLQYFSNMILFLSSDILKNDDAESYNLMEEPVSTPLIQNPWLNSLETDIHRYRLKTSKNRHSG